MSSRSAIEWTDATWNPVRGCSMAPGSEMGGCLHCYAARFAVRHRAEGRPFHGFARITENGPRWTGRVDLVEKHLLDPLSWRSPRRIFVNSMSDLFHESLPYAAIDRVFVAIAMCPQHTFQVLTKRSSRLLEWVSRRFLSGDILVQLNEMEDRREVSPGNAAIARRRIDAEWPLKNVWLGASVENQATADRRRLDLAGVYAQGWFPFVSYEPALDLVNWKGWEFIRWLIVGGESGPGARPLSLRWVRHAIEWAHSSGVACFVKQLGARPGTPSCADLECTHPDCATEWLKLEDLKGGNPEEWPADLRVRQFPASIIPEVAA